MIAPLGIFTSGLINYGIMEGALRLRDAGYVKWSNPILAELKECVQGFIDYGRHLKVNTFRLIDNSCALICPHNVKTAPMSLRCPDQMCSSLQLKGARILTRIADEEESYNAQFGTRLLALALTVAAAVCTILFLLPSGLPLLPQVAIRVAAVAIPFIGAFGALQWHQHPRLLLNNDGTLPKTSVRVNPKDIFEHVAKRLVYTPDMVRKIDLKEPCESNPAQYRATITLEVDGAIKVVKHIPIDEPDFSIIQEELSEGVLSQIPAANLIHTDLAKEHAASMKEQGQNATSVLSNAIVHALEHQ